MLSVVSGAVLLGFQYALLALGVYISFRILNIPDLTVDGSFTFGIAVSAVLCASGHPFLGLMAAVFAGFAAGIVTGFLQTKAKIHPILAGILTMSGLYTVNITIMGAPNVSLIGKKRFYDGFASLFGENSSGDLPKMILAAVICAICVALLIMFFKTVLGLCIRATGGNKDMVRASSINTDVNSGSGMIVIGLASVIIGEVIFGKRSLSVGLVSAVVGSVIYRMIVAFALETNVFSANALKLLSAVIVAVTLSVPAVKNAISDRKMKREGMKNA